jgi:anti-sigma regulatory factor (Ser/Thr protein kinase)
LSPFDPRRGSARVWVPASAAFLSPLRIFLERSLEAWLGEALVRSATEELLVAVQEAVTNVIRHAYRNGPGIVEVALDLEERGEEAEVCVRDTGRPFDPASVEPPDFAHPTPGGYGLHVMRCFADRCEFGRDGRTNWVRLTRRVRAASEIRAETT